MRQLLALLFLLPMMASAQQQTPKFSCFYGERADPNLICMRMRQFSFTPDDNAANAIRNILRPIGLAPNFILVPCDNIQNCAAITLDDGFRYIVYDKKFMDVIATRAQTNWIYTSILAHEVGHHLQGHTTIGGGTLAQRRQQELEADDFSGFVLQKLGATLGQAQAAMMQLPDPQDESKSDHPLRFRRLAAIKAGFDRAADPNAPAPAANPQMPPEQAPQQSPKQGPETPSEKRPKEEPTQTLPKEEPSIEKIPSENTPGEPDGSPSMTKHDIISAEQFPTLRQSWDKGFQMLEAVYAVDRWYVFMKKTTGTKNQSYRLNADFPADEIRKQWDDKKQVTSINFYNNQWVVVTGEQQGKPEQRWRKRAEFPSDEIRTGWDDGYYISDMAYGNGEWVVLMNNKESMGYEDQQYKRTKEFPEKEITDLWAEGYRINVLKYLNGEWVLVMTKFKGSKEVVQRWNTRTYFPMDVLLKNESEGYLMQCAAYDGTNWAIVMNK